MRVILKSVCYLIIIINICNFALWISEECVGARGDEGDCPPVIVSWEGSADIQSGDILIVRIEDSSLDTFIHAEANETTNTNISSQTER